MGSRRWPRIAWFRMWDVESGHKGWFCEWSGGEARVMRLPDGRQSVDLFDAIGRSVTEGPGGVYDDEHAAFRAVEEHLEGKA